MNGALQDKTRGVGILPKRRYRLYKDFTLVTNMTLICTLLVLTSINDFEILHMDAKMAFLKEDLEYEVYMDQPKDFAFKGKENLVCKPFMDLNNYQGHLEKN